MMRIKDNYDSLWEIKRKGSTNTSLGAANIAYKGTMAACSPSGTASVAGDLDYQDIIFELRTDVVPEPASIALLATGLIGIAGASITRRRRNA